MTLYDADDYFRALMPMIMPYADACAAERIIFAMLRALMQDDTPCCALFHCCHAFR